VKFGMILAVCMSATGCLRVNLAWEPWSIWNLRSAAIPETYPLGSTVRAHYHTMHSNGEASDFIFYRHNFQESSATLTSEGKDRLLEMAARMRSAPYPIIIERSLNNDDPELDANRRQLVANVLTDLGNADAEQRVVVSQSYDPGISSMEGETDYYRFIFTRGGNNNNGGGNNGGGGGAGGGIY
ncbi:MAG: hypothetical protein ACKVT0_10920, partial [Planctomycetaceae bacterium]